MSAGGQFYYEFAAWKPERVIAFVVNKDGIYYTALTPRASRDVPGMLFIGGKDLDSRVQTITGLFAVNRRAGALWALAELSRVGVHHRRARRIPKDNRPRWRCGWTSRPSNELALCCRRTNYVAPMPRESVL
jgi:hypothetical protein